MSTTHSDLRLEQEAAIDEAVSTDDEVTLFLYADLAKAMGDDEKADTLLQLAHRARKNNWAYDEAKDNELA